MTDPRFSIIPAGAVLDKQLEARDLQVLCLFGRHIDDNGWCRRSQVRMAKEIGCARSTVQASIDRLVAAGWLEKRSATEVHTPGIRDSAFEYRVLLDQKDRPTTSSGTPADLSAPPADVSENGAEKSPEIRDRHPPAPPADGGFAGVSALQNGHLSAPRLTSPSNQKDARMRSDPTEGLVVVAADSPDFRALTKLRGKRPFVGKNGNVTVTADELARAREAIGLDLAL